MTFHHIAIATADLEAADRFYRGAMGFRLVHVQAGVTEAPAPGGWAKHVFYDTGGGAFLALWDLHDPRVGEFDAALSRGLGLPEWVNHIAFAVDDAAALDTARDRWLGAGYDVLEINHGFTISIYTNDPDGNLVEWCCTVRAFTDEHAREAERLLADPAPPCDPLPTDITFHLAADHLAASV